MSTATLEFIGSYDRRTATGTISSAVAHGLAQNTRKTAIKRGIEECQALARHLIDADIQENEGRYYITTPKLPTKCFVCKALKKDKSALYNTLLDIQRLVLQGMSDAEIFTRSEEYKGDF